MSHEPAYQDVQTSARGLIEQAAGDDKKDLDEKAQDVVTRWEGITGKASKRKAVLDEVVDCSAQYVEALDDVRPLLGEMEEQVKVIENVSSEPATMENQKNVVKVCRIVLACLS